MSEQFEEVKEPKKKTLKKARTPAEKYAHFLQKSVVRHKIVRWTILKNRGWGCSWVSYKLRVGWSSLQIPTEGVLCLI